MSRAIIGDEQHNGLLSYVVNDTVAPLSLWDILTYFFALKIEKMSWASFFFLPFFYFCQWPGVLTSIREHNPSKCQNARFITLWIKATFTRRERENKQTEIKHL